MQLSTKISSLTALRQPSKLAGGQNDQKLVFIYPLVVDASLSKYTNLLRDYLSVEFISQIKISNGLNITSKLSKVGTVGIGDKAINPAVEIRKAFNFSIPNLKQNSSDNDYELYKYQQKINKFSELFKRQIEINPLYNQYSPVVSTIVADENALVFPLILGTKAFPIETMGLFYFLSASIVLDLPLNSLGNFEQIVNFLKNTDLSKFTQIFDMDNESASERRQKNIFPPSKFTPYRQTNPNQNIPGFSNLFKLPSQDIINKFAMSFRTLLSLDKWDAESDHLMRNTSRLSADSVPIIQTATQKRQFENAMGSFNSYVSEAVIPILYGLEVILGPTPSHINFQSAVQEFVNSITKNMDRHYIETAEHIRIKLSELPAQVDEDGRPIYNLNTNIDDKFKSVQYKIDDLKSICKSNIEIMSVVKKILYNELIPHLKISSTPDADSISNFADAVVQSAAKLQGMANTIENWAISAVPDAESNFESKLNQIKELFRTSTNEFLEGGNQYAIYDRNIPSEYFANRYPNFSSLFCGINRDENNPINPRENQQCKDVLYQTITVIKEAMGDILYFLFIWNFMSYICSYVDEIDIDIEIQRKDVLDFPNYTLVVPIEFFKYLYTFYSSSRLKRLLKMKTGQGQNDPEIAIAIQQSISTFVPNASTVKMIQILNDRLKIPNIMVVDSFKGEMYYQFMYMSKPNRVKLNSLPTYINAQKDIIVD